MPIPKVYSTGGAGAIATYDFVDLAAGTGVVIYYGAVSKGPTAEYILMETQLHSAQKETAGGGADFTLNFDLIPFNLPRTAKGTAILSCVISSETQAKWARITAQIKKVSGADITNVSSAITSEDVTGTAVPIDKMLLLEIPLTQTHFKKGDILRLTIINSTLDAGESAIGHSPQNLDGESFIEPSVNTSISTILKLLMPFRIDL